MIQGSLTQFHMVAIQDQRGGQMFVSLSFSVHLNWHGTTSPPKSLLESSHRVALADRLEKQASCSPLLSYYYKRNYGARAG